MIRADQQGVEGSLIRYDEGFDPLDEDQRLQGAKWKVDPSLGMPSLIIWAAPLMTRPLVTIPGGTPDTPSDILYISRSVYGIPQYHRIRHGQPCPL
jgi:hypothetical protein